MSLNGNDDQHPDEHLQVRSEDRVAFTMVGDWVMLANISATAKALYVLMAAHVNVKQGTREVWPAQATLAGWLGLKRAKSVLPYLNELIALGAIEKHAQRDPQNRVTRNMYVVSWNPPKGLTTHKSFGEFYAERNQQRRATTKTVSAGRDVVPQEGLLDEQGNVPREEESAGRDVVPSGGPRSPVEGTPVVPQSAPELDEREQDQQAPQGPPAAPPDPGPRPDEAEQNAIEISRGSRRRRDAANLARTARSGDAQRLVNAWASDLNRRPPARVFSDLCVQVDALLVEQYPHDVITAALQRWNEGNRSVYALGEIAHHVANRAAKPRTTPHQTADSASEATARNFDAFYAAQSPRPIPPALEA